MKTKVLFFIFGIIIFINLISAINLEVKVNPISNTIIPEINEPATFDLTIINNGPKDSFKIYSLVGIDITPDSTFILDKGEKKIIRISVIPQYSLMTKRDLFILEYKIKNSLDETQEEKLTINIVGLDNTFQISLEDIKVNSVTAKINIKNKINYNFPELKIKTSSIFFDEEKIISLAPYETKTIELNLNKEKLLRTEAGNYLVNAIIDTKGKNVIYDANVIRFIEQENINTIEKNKGIIIRSKEITKKNIGNKRTNVEFVIQKNVITYLYTTIRDYPTETKFNGLNVKYIWRKDLGPNEEFMVATTTNWFYPIIIILLIIGLVILIKKFVELDLVLRKEVSFVRTKGGEFALKVSIKAKARRSIENVKIIDRMPLLVHLYDKFGAIHPDKIDEKNKRLEWHIESLVKGEEKIFTYIVYSKIGVVGRFELPFAHATYKIGERLKEVLSNKAYYLYVPPKKR